MKETLRSTDLFLGKKQNGTEKNLYRNTIPFERTYYTRYIYFLLVKFSRISYSVFFFQMLIKYLKINVLHEWSWQFFANGFTSLFIVKGERFSE